MSEQSSLLPNTDTNVKCSVCSQIVVKTAINKHWNANADDDKHDLSFLPQMRYNPIEKASEVHEDSCNINDPDSDKTPDFKAPSEITVISKLVDGINNPQASLTIQYGQQQQMDDIGAEQNLQQNENAYITQCNECTLDSVDPYPQINKEHGVRPQFTFA